MAKIKVKIRNRTIEFDPGTTKADIARTLFEDNAANYTTNEISKAVPMAYSQAMAIKKKMGGQPAPKPKGKDPLSTPQAREATHKRVQARVKPADTQLGDIPPSEWGQTLRAPGKKSMKPMRSPMVDAIKAGKPVKMPTNTQGKVGKLRIPGLPSDTDCGPCANCDFDTVVRSDSKSGQMYFAHVGFSAEEYYATVQFCHAVPKVLLA